MGSDSSAKYIHMVQHLIEECIVFKMSKEECMEALDRHANIKPVITSTGLLFMNASTIIWVWKELEKENKEFFEDYMTKRKEEGEESSATVAAGERIQKLLLDSPGKDTDHES